MKTITINKILIVIFLIAITANCAESQKHAIHDILDKVDTLDIYTVNYNLTNQIEDELLLKEIDSEEFVIIYQHDSLIQKFDKHSDFGYFIGKKKFNSYTSLVILRYYGEWLKTIETLNYSTDGKLIAFMFNAMMGGEDQFYTGKGEYESKDEFFFKYKYENEDGCFQQVLAYHISEQGQITKNSTPILKIECY